MASVLVMAVTFAESEVKGVAPVDSEAKDVASEGVVDVVSLASLSQTTNRRTLS